VGVGVRLPELCGKSITPFEVEQLRSDVGLGQASDWIYLMYDCWAGRIDAVYGLGGAAGQEFGPHEESNVEKAKAAFVELMGMFGVRPADAINFPPFYRDFWGEQSDLKRRKP
jgi:hypothetical protein